MKFLIPSLASKLSYCLLTANVVFSNVVRICDKNGHTGLLCFLAYYCQCIKTNIPINTNVTFCDISSCFLLYSYIINYRITFKEARWCLHVITVNPQANTLYELNGRWWLALFVVSFNWKSTKEFFYSGVWQNNEDYYWMSHYLTTVGKLLNII